MEAEAESEAAVVAFAKSGLGEPVVSQRRVECTSLSNPCRLN